MLKLLGLLFISLALPVHASTIQVSAASSLTEVLALVARKFEATQKHKVNLNFDASSRLARQIVEGSPADLFFSADSEWAVYLKEKKLVKAQKDFLTNSMIVIAPAKSKLSLTKLSDLRKQSFEHLALAHKTVPAGKFASEALSSAGLTDNLKTKIVSGDNVRQVLYWVAKGEADLGIVFKTDLLAEKKVKALLAIPPESHSPIVYSLVLLSSSPEATALFDFIANADNREIFTRAGFGVTN